jgi:uroporphyrinogen decarboxylase
MELLCTGTQGEVRDAVRRAIEIAAPGGGYILSESNSLHPGVKPENCIAMFEAAKEYGRYADPGCASLHDGGNA